MFSNGVILLAGAMLTPIYAIYVESVGGDLLDASFAGALFALAAGVTTLISGRYVDKIEQNKLIIFLGYFIVGTGFLILIFVNSIFLLFIAQIFIGLGEAVYLPAYDSAYSKHVTERKVGIQWGAWESTNYLSRAIGALLGGAIVYNFGFQTLFIIMTIVAYSTAFYIYLLPQKSL